MKHLTTSLLLVAVAFAFSACHRSTNCSAHSCYVGLPGQACAPCPTKPKALPKPKVKKECYKHKWPDRPVRFVTTQVVRRCCHIETVNGSAPASSGKGGKGVSGYCAPYQIEVCETTYKGIYSDGSSKIWTEVSRNPVEEGPIEAIIPEPIKKVTRPIADLIPRPVGYIVGDRGNRPL